MKTHYTLKATEKQAPNNLKTTLCVRNRSFKGTTDKTTHQKLKLRIHCTAIWANAHHRHPIMRSDNYLCDVRLKCEIFNKTSGTRIVIGNIGYYLSG